MLITSKDVDQQAVLDFIVRKQQSPSTACAYLGTDAAGIQNDLEDLDQHWTETVQVRVSADGQVVGAAVIEWDEDMDRSWVHGPWVEEDRWRTEAPALLAAVMAQAPVGLHEMYAHVAHEQLAWLASQSGWREGEANFEYVRLSPAPEGSRDPDIRAAATTDRAAVQALHEMEFPGTYASTSELLEPGSDYSTLVFAPDGEVLGYVASQVQGDSTVYVDFVAVHPEVRRAGIGARLIDAAQRESGRGKVSLTVDEHRPRARAFYASIGFSLTSSTRPYRSGHAAPPVI